MVCEYFSKQNGKLFCRVYGAIEATEDKIKECQSSPHDCYTKASQSLEGEIRRDDGQVLEPYISSRFFNRAIFRI